LRSTDGIREVQKASVRRETKSGVEYARVATTGSVEFQCAPPDKVRSGRGPLNYIYTLLILSPTSDHAFGKHVSLRPTKVLSWSEEIHYLQSKGATSEASVDNIDIPYALTTNNTTERVQDLHEWTEIDKENKKREGKKQQTAKSCGQVK